MPPGRAARVVLALVLLLAAARPGLAQRAPRTATRNRAAIDMGSSGIKLLVTDPRGRTLADEKIGASLGKGIGRDRLLPKENRLRAVAALETLVARAARFGVAPGQIEVITTAAVRNANGRMTAAARRARKTTGQRFLDGDVRRGLGLSRARILTGEEEALLGHQGALIGWQGPADTVFAVVDTGGGSHQVIVGTRAAIKAAGSTQIGSNQVAEQALVTAAGGTLDVVTPKDFAEADRRMAALVPSLPIDAAGARGAVPVVTGGTAKFLGHYFRKDSVTRADIEALRAKVGALPTSARAALVKKDVTGKAFTRRTRQLLGLHAAGAAGGEYGAKLPAKLTLLLRVMSLLEVTEIHLAQTDARHALVGGAAPPSR
jgi:exopolyphosphatase/pppGpp-phosphohydrolase